MIIQERGRIWQEVDFLSKIPTLLPPCLKIPSVFQVFRAVVLSPVQRLALASGSQTLACVRMTYRTFKNTASPASRISDSVGLEQGSRICFSHKFSGNVIALVPGRIFENHRSKFMKVILSFISSFRDGNLMHFWPMKGSLQEDSRKGFFADKRKKKKTVSLLSPDVIILNAIPRTVAAILETSCESQTVAISTRC